MQSIKNILLSSLASSFALVAGSAASLGQCGAIKVVASTPTVDDQLGSSIAVGVNSSNQTRVVVGAPNANLGAFFDCGVVKVFARPALIWGEIGTISSPASLENNRSFGASVGYDGTRIIVGEPGRLSDDGAAYIFEFQGSAWTPVGTFPGAQNDGRTGAAVAIDGDYALIGTPMWNSALSQRGGLVSVVKRNANGTWSQSQSFTESVQFSSFQNLGQAVALKDAVAVMGAPSATIPGSPTGHGWVRIARLNGATFDIESQYFSPGPRKAGAGFGSSVATDGSRIIVGAPGYSFDMITEGANISGAGAAWVLVFSNGNWVVEGLLRSTAPVTSGAFGTSVSIDGNRAIVSEPGAKAVYAFRRTPTGDWVADRRYTDEDNAGNGSFGSAVAASSTGLYIGDEGDDSASAADAGAFYIKALPAGYSDSCEGAFPITGTSVNGCTLETTPDTVPMCNSVSGTATGNSAWMSWTPTCSGNVIIDTLGSNFDTVLSVHNACPASTSQPTVVACNDDVSIGSTHSLVTFNVDANTRYLINVRGFSTTNNGNFTLRINQWQIPGNDTCQTAFTAAVGANTFSNCRANTDNITETACGAASTNMVNDVWYKFTPNRSAALTLTTCGSTFDTVLNVYNGACPFANNFTIACNDDGGGCGQFTSKVTFNAVAGTTYRIRVSGYSTTLPTGDGVLNVSLECKADFDNSGAVTVDDIFIYLNAWFAQNPACDFDNSGSVTIDDIFIFLNAWFAGC